MSSHKIHDTSEKRVSKAHTLYVSHRLIDVVVYSVFKDKRNAKYFYEKTFNLNQNQS